MRAVSSPPEGVGMALEARHVAERVIGVAGRVVFELQALEPVQAVVMGGGDAGVALRRTAVESVTDWILPRGLYP